MIPSPTNYHGYDWAWRKQTLMTFSLLFREAAEICSPELYLRWVGARALIEEMYMHGVLPGDEPTVPLARPRRVEYRHLARLVRIEFVRAYLAERRAGTLPRHPGPPPRTNAWLDACRASVERYAKRPRSKPVTKFDDENPPHKMRIHENDDVVIDALDVRVTVTVSPGKVEIDAYDKNCEGHVVRRLAVPAAPPEITDADLKAHIAALDQLTEAAINFADTPRTQTLSLSAVKSRAADACLNYGRFVISQRALGRPVLSPLAVLEMIAQAAMKNGDEQ